jgi:DNA-directed RNA polymerase specialized sigma54-like protein
MADDANELGFLLDRQSVLAKEIKERQEELDAIRSKINVLQTIQSLPPTGVNNETLQSSGGTSGSDVRKDDHRS